MWHATFGAQKSMSSKPAQASKTGLVFHLHGAAAFQLLAAGTELGLFTRLESENLTMEGITHALRLSAESARALVAGLRALGIIVRDGDHYGNGDAIHSLFANDEWDVFEATVGFQAKIVYEPQGGFVHSLRRGIAQGMHRRLGETNLGVGDMLYKRLGEQPDLQRAFYRYMDAYSEYANKHLFKSIDFSSAKRVLDVGGGGGMNAISLAKRYQERLESVW